MLLSEVPFRLPAVDDPVGSVDGHATVGILIFEPVAYSQFVVRHKSHHE